MDDFIRIFMKWNERINLSAARSRDEVEEHIEDSKAVLPFLSGRVLDVGSGGGFPVLIAAIERTDLQFVALEPNHKKHAFLREVIRELGLNHLEARCERLESHASADYDVAMSRATFDLSEWLAMGAARVCVGGLVLGFEGVERVDVVDVERHRYVVRGKNRAIVALRVGERREAG